MFHVKFADIGEGIHEGVVFKVYIENGAQIEEGDNIMAIETDKVTADIPSPVSGTIENTMLKPGDKVFVGDVIAVIQDGAQEIRTNMVTEEETQDVPATPQKVVESVSETGSTSVVGTLEVSSELIKSSAEVHVAKATMPSKVLATPVARKMAKDLGVDITKIEGSGPAGRVMKADIQRHHNLAKERASSQEVSDQEPQKQKPHMEHNEHSNDPQKTKQLNMQKQFEAKMHRKPMSMIRKKIAAEMTKSKYTIPHTSVMDDIDVTRLVDYRQGVKQLAADNGVKLTYMPFIIKAVTVALVKHEILNASYDDEAEEILIKKFYNIGIAIDSPYGLLVPVVHNTNHLSIFEIANTIDDLNHRTKDKKLHLHELSHGTFTITNYGTFGSSYGVPIIRHPEASILGIGTIKKKPVVIDDEIVIRSIMPISLSFDHRLIDGGEAVRFIQTLKSLLENPDLLMLG